MQFLVKAGSSICANHTPESYPESYPKNHDYECFFWDRFKLIDQCWPDPMIPGYLHIPSRSGEFSPRAQSLIIVPKLAGSGWLAQLLLLVGWLAIGLASCYVADEADEGDDSGCGWLVTKPKLRRRGA